ncbi:MAG TPA: hypothetical protein VGM98_01855 [Schlesneria sp.]
MPPLARRCGLIISMQFQKAHVSIIRSIRHVSLARDWHRSRGKDELPKFATFVPNERAGDAADLLVNEVRRDGGELFYLCVAAGARVEQVYDEKMPSRFLHECLDGSMANAAKPIWDACTVNQLPVYSIIPLADRDGVPVTVEQIFLPYSRDGSRVDFMVAALHACSTESRFAHQGLLRGIAKAPLHWAVMIDPSMSVAPRPEQDSGHGIVLDDMFPAMGAAISR